MAKTMRLALLAVALGTANAQTTGAPSSGGHGAVCAWHGIKVADELMNSIVYIWQGTKRCGTPHKPSECSVDVSYAIQAVQNVLNSIMLSVDSCGGMLTQDQKCYVAWGEVTGAMAGVAGASSEIADVCPKDSLETVASRSQPFPHGLAMCIIDSKDLFWSVFRAGVYSADASDKCSYGESSVCTDAVLRATAAFASMGEFIAGVVGYCTAPTAPVNHKAAKCSNAVLGLIHQLSKLSVGGNHLHHACDINEAQRLYLKNDGHHGVEFDNRSNLPTLATLAFLPIAAVMSFVAGRKMSRSRHTELAGSSESRTLTLETAEEQ